MGISTSGMSGQPEPRLESTACTPGSIPTLLGMNSCTGTQQANKEEMELGSQHKEVIKKVAQLKCKSDSLTRLL